MKILKSIKSFFGYTTLEDKSVQQLLIDDGWIDKSDVAKHTHQISTIRFEKSVIVNQKERVDFFLCKCNDMFIFYVKFNVVSFNYKTFYSAPTRKEIKEIISDTVHLASINF